MSFLNILEHLVGHNAGHPQPGQSNNPHGQMVQQTHPAPAYSGPAFSGQPETQDQARQLMMLSQPQAQHMLGNQMQQDAGGYGTPIQNAYVPRDIQGNNSINQYAQIPQGGQFNPGFSPLQNQHLNYNQAPQHPFSIY